MQRSIAERMAFYASDKFDAAFRYDGRDLGVSCRPGKTVFKVWSPLAERVELRLYRDGDSKACLKKEMLAGARGVWTQEFQESLHGMYYDYLVRIEGEDVETADPYATGCSCNGGRSMAVDLGLTNPAGFEADKAPAPAQERIIYELLPTL